MRTFPLREEQKKDPITLQLEVDPWWTPLQWRRVVSDGTRNSSRSITPSHNGIHGLVWLQQGFQSSRAFEGDPTLRGDLHEPFHHGPVADSHAAIDLLAPSIDLDDDDHRAWDYAPPALFSSCMSLLPSNCWRWTTWSESAKSALSMKRCQAWWAELFWRGDALQSVLTNVEGNMDREQMRRSRVQLCYCMTVHPDFFWSFTQWESFPLQFL
jgi:hypothetical protein